MTENCGFDEIIFLSTYSQCEKPFGGVLSKNFFPQRVASEKSAFLPVSNISSFVPTGRDQKLCLYRNFLPSRGRSREKLKIKFFKKIFPPKG